MYVRKELLARGDEEIAGLKQLRLVYRSTFNMKYFYYLMHEWFVDEGFGTRDDASFPEVMYIHRDSGKDKEIWWRWRFETTSPTGPLFRWCFDFEGHVLGHKEVEILVGGEKVKADSGELEIFVTPYCYITSSKWDKNPLLKAFKPVLRNVVYRKMVDKEKKLYERKLWEAQEAVKTYLKLETYLPEHKEAAFYPKADFS